MAVQGTGGAVDNQRALPGTNGPCPRVRMAGPGAPTHQYLAIGGRDTGFAPPGTLGRGGRPWARGANERGYDAPMLMARVELDLLDAPGCPLLGLAADRRSHFTYPHPGHRCFATGRPATTDARRQATYCLSPGYTACDRYRAWQGPVESRPTPRTQATRRTRATPDAGAGSGSIEPLPGRNVG